MKLLTGRTDFLCGMLIGLACESTAATFRVISVDDAGPGSLRQCISEANALPGFDRVEFGIGFGPQTIAPQTVLPTITEAVVIDATTQPGYSGSPLIELSGENVSSRVQNHGLLLLAGNSTVRGLVINRFPGAGIAIGQGGSNVVEACYVGIDLSGSVSLGNRSGGLYIGSAQNRIGGELPGGGNVISGNSNDGIILIGRATTNNFILGNIIGLSADGSHPVGNAMSGVFLNGASENQVGGTNLAQRNIISGNEWWGVTIASSRARRNRVWGNFVGVDLSGRQTGYGNFSTGIYIFEASDNDLGGVEPGSGNVISGNRSFGIYVVGPEADGNRIRGNWIGLAADGDGVIGNGIHGILIEDGSTNVIGGSLSAERNVISGNDIGIGVTGAQAVGNRIQGNWVGLNAQGQSARPNLVSGIVVNAPLTIVGGRTPDERNVCSGNLLGGIQLEDADATGSVVLGNFIGTDPTGLSTVPNGLDGIFARNLSICQIGGALPGEGNLISGNGRHGLNILECVDVRVLGNRIGVGADGSSPLGNRQNGLTVRASLRNQVGGRSPGEGNLIAHHPGAGVSVETGSAPVSRPSAGNAIVGNSLFENLGPGVDLGEDGSTPNDPLDEDTGPNGLQNYPTLDHASATAGHIAISGRLSSAPDMEYWIDLYLGKACSDPARPEGRQYLGHTRVRTDAHGTAEFRSAFAHPQASPGQSVTATATDTDGNTSELCPCLTIEPGVALSIRFLRDIDPPQIELRWVDAAVIWTLEESIETGKEADWTEVAAIPVVVGDVHVVRLPIEGASHYFRLRR